MKYTGNLLGLYQGAIAKFAEEGKIRIRLPVLNPEGVVLPNCSPEEGFVNFDECGFLCGRSQVLMSGFNVDIIIDTFPIKPYHRIHDPFIVGTIKGRIISIGVERSNDMNVNDLIDEGLESIDHESVLDYIKSWEIRYNQAFFGRDSWSWIITVESIDKKDNER